MECLGKSRVVYFTVQHRDHCEAARFHTDTPADEVKGQQNYRAWGDNIKNVFGSPRQM
jgi:hypothetical protein